MGVSYDKFTDAFLQKVTEYDFLTLDTYDRTHIVDGYMKRACAQFNKICKKANPSYDLTKRDDKIREFTFDIDEDVLDEILDIVSEGMCVQWFKPYIHRADNLENVLNTADFSAYSPAELLYRITNAYKEVRRTFTNMMREYSYQHGDLTDLHL